MISNAQVKISLLEQSKGILIDNVNKIIQIQPNFFWLAIILIMLNSINPAVSFSKYETDDLWSTFTVFCKTMNFQGLTKFYRLKKNLKWLDLFL